ncbi:MAG: TonB-dependent receptor [Gammaproteobacteria bacterium]|nr:TonB-dependent receptor [Gammaproteobacteria bacterium]
MNSNKSYFRARRSLIALAVLAGGWSSMAAAQVKTIPVGGKEKAPPAQEEATQLDEIEVTGSRIKRTDFETAQPVLSIGREDIERTGLTSIGDLLQNLAEAGSALNTAVNNGGNGSVEVDLRNLGSNRVLVLVNGRRWVNGLRSNSTASVDLNTIPVSIIERVEVLKDGASAVYGSDAVAGVVNIITRKNFAGAEARAQYGQYTQGDGQSNLMSFSLGSVSGATSIFTDVSYVLQEEVFAGDRRISREPLFGTGNVFGSSRTPQGRFVFIPDQTVSDGLACRADGFCNLSLKVGEDGKEVADFEGFNNSKRYNFAPINYLLTPNERSSIFTALNHDFGNVLFGNPLAFQGEFLYNVRKSVQQLAETPVDVGDFASAPFNTLYVAEDNPFNPFQQDIGRTDPNSPDGVGGGVIFRRMTDLGPRIFSQNVDTYRLGGGFKGSFDLFERFVSWDAGYTFAESRNTDLQRNLVNVDRLRLAVGPIANCNNTPGCVPLNLFGGQGTTGTGSMTSEMLRYVGYDGQGSQKQRQNNFYAYFSHELVSLPAGMVGMAYGLEYRKEYFQDIPDPLVQAGASSTNRGLPTSGGYNVKEAYVEFNVPVLSGIKGVDALDISAALRYSDYNSFGSDTNYKFGVRYKPYADLLVRGTVSTAFRAPGVSDLFLGLSDSYPQITDPCAGATGDVAARCQADGVSDPANYQQLNTQELERLGGNPNLTPEEADTFTAGIVYSPEFVPDLNIYLDWYSIDLTNAITTLGSQNILDLCYTAGAGDLYCDLVDRNSNTGGITEIRNTFLNIGGLKVEGLDIAADYVLPWLRDYGTFTVKVDSSYLTRFSKFIANASGGLDELQYEGSNQGDTEGQGFPRLKANTSVDWAFGPWSANYRLRYVHHQLEENCEGLEDFGLCDVVKTDADGNVIDADNNLGSATYHDVQVGYNLSRWNMQLTGGINNLFDKDPPVSITAFANSFDSSLYDVPGVFPYLRLTKSF